MLFSRVCRILPTAAAVLAAAQAPLLAQNAPASPAFEVASIHQNMNPNPAWRMNFTPDGLSAVDVTLQWVLGEAYGLYDAQRWSGAPAWVNQKRFDIQAKYDVAKYPHPTMDERKAMLQNLLADRFKLVVHHQPKDFPLYALVIAKGGPKLEEAKPEDILHSGLDGRPMCQHGRGGRGVIHLEGCTVGDLALTLSNWAKVNRGRAVVGQTGLTGRYTIALQWTPDNAPATPQQDFSGPSMLTAVKEQLGLELKPIKGPLDTIVIDHIEMPSEN